MSTRTRPRTHLADAKGLLTGLQKSPPAQVKSFALDGESLTTNQLIAEIQEIEELNQAALDLKAQWLSAMAAARAQAKANQTKLTRIRRTLIAAYGPDTAGLAACGIVVAAPAPRTAETNAIAAARAAETRKVNGTGKKPAPPKPMIRVIDEDGTVIGETAPAVSAPATTTVEAPGVPRSG